MVATAIYSVTMVLCRAMERRWKRNVVSRVSSVIVVIRLPISCVSSMTISCHVQLFLWQMGRRCVLANLEYLSILFCADFWAAAPGMVAVLPMWDSAYVSGTVTSQAIGFPLAYGKRVVPSGRLLSSRIRLIGSLTLYYYYYCLSHQHKAAGRKTRIDIQNYGCNGNLLCYHGVVERNRISSFAEPWKGVGQNWQ